MKKKVLWYGEFLNPTGFSQVSKALVANLKSELEITVLDWQKQLAHTDNPMQPIPMDGFSLLGCLGEKDGQASIQMQFMNIHKYDSVFIINDVWNINYVLQILKFRNYKGDVICYFPVDAERHTSEWYENFDIVTHAVTYTNFAYNEVIKVAPRIKHKLSVIPHGIDPKVFYPVNKPKSKIREELWGTKALNDKFIFLNANRNQPRKRLDITMEAFAIASRKDRQDKLRLYMHCGNTDNSINVAALAKRLKIDGKLIMSCNPDFHGMINIPIEKLNLIYNACDLGINTSMGEGWGLTAHEMAAAGKPQIGPAHSAVLELFQGISPSIKTIAPYTFDNIMTIGKIVSAEHLAKLMTTSAKLSTKDYNQWAQKTYQKFTSEAFLWPQIAKKWRSLFYDTEIC